MPDRRAAVALIILDVSLKGTERRSSKENVMVPGCLSDPDTTEDRDGAGRVRFRRLKHNRTRIAFPSVPLFRPALLRPSVFHRSERRNRGKK